LTTTAPVTFQQSAAALGGVGYASTDSVDALIAFIRRARSALVVTHAKPDGDAVGSSVGLARTLARLGVDAGLLYVGPVPGWAEQFTRELPLRTIAPGTPIDPVGMTPDLVVIVDTGSWSQLSELRPLLQPRADRSIIIDHHLHGDPNVAERRLIQRSAASCTQVLAPLCAGLLGVSSCSALPLEIAEPLYLGLATDTGWLRYSSVSPATLRLAAELLEAGVDHTRLYRIIEQQDAPARWMLFGRALTSLEIARSGSVAIMSLSNRDFAETGAERDQTNGFADMLLTVASVELSVVLSEQDAPSGTAPVTKLSFRSKPGPGAIDVNVLAKTFGGGGHARAAGAKFSGTVSETKARLLSSLASMNAS
jgi:bifunctional oligoribonuclease and PAP phosphatase NrnA